MAIRLSRYTPPTIPAWRAQRLNWTEDPLYRISKPGITAPQANAGLAYDKALYAPDSPLLRSVVTPTATPTYPTGPITTSLGELGRGLTRFGSGGRPGVAQVSYPTRPGITNPNIAADGPDESDLFPPSGNAGPVGDGGPMSPALDSVSPVDSPNLGALPPSPLTTGAFTASMPAGGDTNPPTNPPTGSARSPSGQTQRFYDRKFGKSSGDQAERMQARRIDAHAPVVDGSNNLRSSSDPNRPSVSFSSTNPDGTPNGHSDWTPY